ncbi:MAG: TauD/TfdA family dioxygenase [Gammaproteobacteria bacterium]|jgi:taurine dioxygenase|nr:TauD/TfdA family dioxygenase [Gammaproteobacteria bacterium]MBT5202554.1 TauD/TfdA family dioxygenase [Gammaproteobacteria bacterium]MBT5603538.1 TauD/TfdA family dioxygenase [Gammaproteobacteria bacterium]MBT6244461.1 TauD/TfdA family dioxygenase [Gammaproteobacteria bacterium]
MNINPISLNFAAEVSDIDVRSITNDEFNRVYEAWLTYGVLRIRRQHINEDELQAFSSRFGPLEEIPMGRLPESERAKIKNRYVTQLSNILKDGKPIGGLGNAEASWHSDMTYIDNPPPASVLLGIEIPEKGGDTYFADQNAALMAIPDDLLARLRGLSIKHNAAHTSVGKLRPGFEAFDDPRDAPGSVHPVITAHPETGKQALYLGRREWAYIPGLELDDSEALLDEIWSYAALPENVWQQQWQPFDLIIWDNRRVLHRRDDFNQSARRLMKRCQVLSKLG